jgi:hypothetical protein
MAAGAAAIAIATAPAANNCVMQRRLFVTVGLLWLSAPSIAGFGWMLVGCHPVSSLLTPFAAAASCNLFLPAST